MKRLLAAFVTTCGLALLLAPIATGLGVEADANFAARGETEAVEDVPASAPGLTAAPADLRLENFLAAQGSVETGIEGGSGGSTDQGGRDASTGIAKDDGSWIPDRPQEAAQIATAATGLAVLVGLAAHYWGTLKFGATGLLLPLFSRIQSNQVLDNGVRNRVHDAVTQNPGITIKEIAQLCAIGWGTAVYHLKRLEGERLIVSERQRQFRRFYKNGGGIVNETKAAFGELKNPTGQRIAETILASPGSCQKEVCERVGISAPLAHKYLSRLEEAGLVETQREWRSVRYFPTTKLEDLLLVARPAPASEALVATPIPVAA